jgi:rhamnosyltransferase
VDAYSSNVIAFWGNGREVFVDKSQQQCRWDFLFEAAGPGCTYVLKVEVVEKFKELLVAKRTEVREIGLHDWFIYAFTRANGYKWIIDPKPSMAYRQHAINQVGANVGWRAFQARMNRILGGWGITQARLIAQLSGLENDFFCIPWKRRGRVGMLWLAVNAYRCRRKVLDRFVFAGACLLLAIVGDRSDEQR